MFCCDATPIERPRSGAPSRQRCSCGVQRPPVTYFLWRVRHHRRTPWAPAAGRPPVMPGLRLVLSGLGQVAPLVGSRNRPLAALATGGPQIFPRAAGLPWCRLRRRSPFLVGPLGNILARPAGRYDGPLPAQRRHQAAGKDPTVPGCHPRRPVLPHRTPGRMP